MTDVGRILPLWRDLEAAALDYVLATVVAVEGSSYRRPGACMLLTPDGRRAGTVSGGCLEAQVASRAWWLTANGPTIQRYSTAEEDGDLPYGSGCGGVVFLLLERRSTAAPLLAALEQAFQRRVPLAVATILDGPLLGHRAFAGLEFAGLEQDPFENPLPHPGSDHGSAAILNGRSAPLQDLAQSALTTRQSMERIISIEGRETRAWADFRPARPGLHIFGAGDDAKPLLSLAKELGWFVSVADGRSHLATRERFPMADRLSVLPIRELSGNHSVPPEPAFASLQPQDAAVAMTHSFEQDTRVLGALLSRPTPPAFIGVLGPQRRTREMLREAARQLHLTASTTLTTADWIERWLAQLHAPMGLDLGADSPETIAFSILAEIQKTLTAATALPLREVRNSAPAIPGTSVS